MTAEICNFSIHRELRELAEKRRLLIEKIEFLDIRETGVKMALELEMLAPPPRSKK